MKKSFLLLAIFALTALAAPVARAADNARDVRVLDNNWLFINSDQAKAEQSGIDESAWEHVRVPHDWAIGKPFDMNIDDQMVTVTEDGEKVARRRTGRTGALPWIGVGWYRMHLFFNPAESARRHFVEFDGAMAGAQVYMNGKYVGEWPYGYSSFSMDVTPMIDFGKDNVLAVRLENKPASSRWYPGAGLYRQVRLVSVNPVFVPYHGTYITTPQVSDKKATVDVRTTISTPQMQSGGTAAPKNVNGVSGKYTLVTELYGPDGKLAATAKQDFSPADLLAGVGSGVKDNNQTWGQSNTQTGTGSGAGAQTGPQPGEIRQTLTVNSPALWSCESPKLYTAHSKIYQGGRLLDDYTTSFGIRTINFDPDKGFSLNGKIMKFKGVCMHHDLGPLGAAFNVRAAERQLQILAAMGCNAIRTSHNPPAPQLLDLCDRMGFLVMDEAFDEWREGKNANGYHLLFDKWSRADLEALVKRDRNHPCVVLWSIGNEVKEYAMPDGSQVARYLRDICHELDPTRPVTAAVNLHTAAIKNGFGDVLDVMGFNYKPFDYARYHTQLQMPMFGSETSSTVSTRDFYQFPAKIFKGAIYDNYQVSGYDVDYVPWGQLPDEEWGYQEDNSFVMGEFVWTGFDYLGEPTPYNEATPARSSYFGIVDLAGLPKDRYYLYQSHWGSKPMLHVVPHWTWPDRLGQNVPVFCYTTYPSAELFVNGKSMGKRTRDKGDLLGRYRLMWNDVVYQPGQIEVVAYDAAGKEAAREVVKTAGAPFAIRMTADRATIDKGDNDLSFVTVEIVDKDGNLCPRSDAFLMFDWEGTMNSGRLVALCNGDATDQTGFSSRNMRVFCGRMVAVVEGGEKAGKFTLKAAGNLLRQGKVDITVK